MDRAALDREYEDFLRTLEPRLHEAGKKLAHSLGLAPIGVPWSEVFGNEVTLGAPALVVCGGASDDATRFATRAHMLAVIEAFARDRLEDGQVTDTTDLDALLDAIRAERDRALRAVSAEPDVELDFDRASRLTLEAIRRERALFERRSPVTFDEYLAVSSDKQRLGLPATLALARAAGWDARRRSSASSMLMSIWLALQLHDDVVDWPEDLRHGGAWALCLALRTHADARQGDRDESVILASNVLAEMLRRSRRFYAAARRRARALGALDLARWAGEREAIVREAEHRENAAAGAASRAHRLAAWARVVLS